MNFENQYKSIDPEELQISDVYKLMIGSIIPRPIALVSTVNGEGKGNLAPFSYFNAVSSRPAVLAFSVTSLADGSKKHTLRNIEETGQFVINSSNEWMLEQVAGAGADYPFGIDELKMVGLTPIESVSVKPTRVSESVVQFECELYNLIPVGDGSLGSATLVLGKVLLAHIRSDAIDGTKIDPNIHRPLARLGGTSYSTLGEILNKPIPKV